MSTLRAIGAVVAELREEFAELTASKIRFLEEEGLVTPLRTARGSRRYTDDDVAVLRRVLRLQRDEFLPLAVIRERILEEEPQPTGTVQASRLRASRPRRMTRAEVAQRGGVSSDTLNDLIEHGLVVEMDSSAVEICRLISSLAEWGIEPRHLRSFRAAADREVGLVQQALAPRRASVPVVEHRQHMAALLAQLLDLHICLVRQRSSSLEA